MTLRLKRSLKTLRRVHAKYPAMLKIAQVGTISANGEAPAIGKMIAEGHGTVGNEGVITVEETRASRRSWTSSKACSSIAATCRHTLLPMPRRWSANLENPFILLHEKKLLICSHAPRFRSRGATGKPLLIVAEEVEGEALATLVVNKLRGGLRLRPSRRRALAIVVRRCWRTWPSSPVAR